METTEVAGKYTSRSRTPGSHKTCPAGIWMRSRSGQSRSTTSWGIAFSKKFWDDQLSDGMCLLPGVRRLHESARSTARMLVAPSMLDKYGEPNPIVSNHDTMRLGSVSVSVASAPRPRIVASKNLQTSGKRFH